MCVGVGRECRCSGASRGISSTRGLLGGDRGVLGLSGGLEPTGHVGGFRGALGAGREYLYSGASRGICGIMGLLGGVGDFGHQGVS